MSGRTRLSSLADIAGPASRPAYEPGRHGCGIVHLGAGAFHRAHQADYTDAALAARGGDWRIIGVSLRGHDVADALNPQNGLYTLIERDAAGARAKVIGSIERVIAASREPDALMQALVDPAIRIVTITVTEKAYGVDRSTMTADLNHPSVAADLTKPTQPVGVLGVLTEALRLRRAADIAPFTVLCCDNLPDNGAFVRAGVIDFARRLDPSLADWIAANIAFPSSMVDRITPAATQQTIEDAMQMTGCLDQAAIETEPFRQWVIEDRFPSGRPAWEAGGALFVEDVHPYETMKLRMLNGSHSMLAYVGFLTGRRYVRDTVGPGGFPALIVRHLSAAASTLRPLSGIGFETYAKDVIARFANPAIAHETRQIAMDGTQKLPQRLLAPAVELLNKGGDIGPFAFAVAAWMRYCLGRLEDGASYTLNDPRQDEIATAISGVHAPADIARALHALPGLFPDRLRADQTWLDAVSSRLERMMVEGMQPAITFEMALSPT